MDTRTIFFVGKPGSGKGTQAKLLAAETGWPVFAAGTLFRTIAKEATSAGRKVKEEMEAGLLVPHWFAMYLYLKTLFSIPEHQNAIFDGFNRKVAEAELVVDSLRWLGRAFTVVDVVVSDTEVEKRLALRKETSGRVDDTVVSERLKEFHTFTAPAIEIFRNAGVLIEVNGEQSREDIARDVLAALGLK